MAHIPIDEKILVVIRKEPGVNRAQLHRALHNRVTSRILTQSLERLRQKGLARPRRSPSGGRPAECWFPCQDRHEATKALSMQSADRVLVIKGTRFPANSVG